MKAFRFNINFKQERRRSLIPHVEEVYPKLPLLNSDHEEDSDTEIE